MCLSIQKSQINRACRLFHRCGISLTVLFIETREYSILDYSLAPDKQWVPTFSPFFQWLENCRFKIRSDSFIVICCEYGSSLTFQIVGLLNLESSFKQPGSHVLLKQNLCSGVLEFRCLWCSGKTGRGTNNFLYKYKN